MFKGRVPSNPGKDYESLTFSIIKLGRRFGPGRLLSLSLLLLVVKVTVVEVTADLPQL